VKRSKASFFFSAFLTSCLFLAHLQSALALEVKKSDWLASCPEVMDSNPELPTPKTQNLVFLNTGQEFKLLAKNSTDFAQSPQSIIGCYVIEKFVTDPSTSPNFQIGSLSRDTNGYYFTNAAKTIWRLTYNPESSIMETRPGSLYYKKDLGFRLDRIFERATDCKVKNYSFGAIRLGFPRNSDRVDQLGTTNNLILLVDFPDARLTEPIDSLVRDVLAPRTVERFLSESSNGKFTPTFTVFPKVITLNSLDSSFSSKSTKYFSQGIQQDHRLVKEAVGLAQTFGQLDGYSSIHVFAPTSKALGYYGSAFVDMPLQVGGKTLLNSQLMGQIGTVNSPVPSWKVFAHEYGHLLGMYDYYIQGTGSSGKSPGPFDLMGNTTGSANTFFGFQRWVQGWLEDADVICNLSANSGTSHTLVPLNNKSGKRLFVHPIDGTTTLVIEHRTDSEFDALNGNDGLLVYVIDMKVASSEGPISIQPSEQDLALNPRDDVERYSRAPLSSGQSVKVRDLVIVAEDVSKDRAAFRVLTIAEFQVKQDAEAKAAADLKAKQDAEAKAAADLKAKQEADARAAAEIKAKQEADAKAAAELKAKQDAETKAAVKKITITCTKGKLTKKVTAVKPKCPAGYKLKK
jgi:M6 family metalloprotease-like protein